MPDARWLAGVAVAAVLGGTVAGAVVLWPTRSPSHRLAAHRSTASADAAVVDGILDGTRVRATGDLVRLPGGAELCLGGGLVLDSSVVGAPTDSADCTGDVVQLRGIRGGSGEARRRSVVGTWVSGTIVVREVRPPEPDPDESRLDHPPCPEPPGGWSPLSNYDLRTPNIDYRALDHYRHLHPHVIAGVASFRPKGFGPVLTIASTEPEATQSALESAYPKALCVVASTHAPDVVAKAYHRLQKALYAGKVPGMFEVGKQISPAGQPVIEIGAQNDRPELEAVLRGIPQDLIELHVQIEILHAA